MKKISEEQIFDLIDEKLSDDERSELLKKLAHYPEEERLYRSLLMTDGYVSAHAIEKPSTDFDDKLLSKFHSIINRKKRNGILYRALSIFGLITVSSLIGSILLMATSGSTAQPSLNLQKILSVSDQFGGSLALISGESFQLLVLLIVAFAFFVFADRLLMKYFNFRHQ